MSTKVDDTLHLKNFIEKVNRADNSQQREVKIDIEHAKRVRNALTTLLIHYVDRLSKVAAVLDFTLTNLRSGYLTLNRCDLCH